jgi:hypothetical protein
MGSSAGIVTESNYKYATDGVGCSFKLPTSATDITAEISFDVNPGGTVFASYQHAAKTSTLAKSQNYTFHYAGYGNVFLFDSSVEPYYDGMGGVYISLN